ncbi:MULTISPECIES: hypothetical protein [unclassified Bradyrhizobium]|uniref:hypothetical protein n=1 Tax=unclassified Bradyrhizobium TaxID=2631580 RepID=UPI0012ECA1D3|nr:MULTISPECIES: hypothetical protein [unclassified Bradyrhizobium]QIG96544.1 hypothetical protein G6P99_31825 [Bradyrhizobium sp. 6(2017)]
MAKKPHAEKEIELESDAWQRFERAVEVVSKSPPQRRVAKSKKQAKRKPVASKKKA